MYWYTLLVFASIFWLPVHLSYKRDVMMSNVNGPRTCVIRVLCSGKQYVPDVRLSSMGFSLNVIEEPIPRQLCV